MMLKFKTSAAALVAVTFLLSGCGLRQMMYDDSRIKPHEETSFFEDSRTSRVPVEGTLAQGQFKEADPHYYLGKQGSAVAKDFPPQVKVDRKLLELGKKNYMIYCALCHGTTGWGDGMIVQRGFKKPDPFHEDRLKSQPVGYYFNVMTKGKGYMPSYKTQLNAQERWAVAAYLKVLQLSQSYPINKLTDKEKSQIGAPAEEESHGHH